MLVQIFYSLSSELIKSGLPGAMQLAKITHAYRAFSSFCGIKFSYNKLHNIANWSILTSDATKISVINFCFSKIIKNSNLCTVANIRHAAKNAMNLLEI